MQEQPQASGPVGGLADKALGGLTKFMTNVNRGVERVLSNPLYERAWSGMVSGMYGDPMAGPLAVQQLRQNAMSQEIQRREMKAMEESPTQRAIRESEENARLYRLRLDERLSYTPMSDPQYREAWAARYPLAYGKQAFAAPKAGGRPLQVMRDGRPTYVAPEDAIGMEPVPRAPLVQNTVGVPGMTNATTTKVQGQQLDAQDTIARLDEIRASFKPEFQNWGSKLGQKWLSAKDSAGAGLSEPERSQLTDMSRFQASAYENMSRILNQLSGAAISPAEFERLSRFLPNVGSGVFDGDSPTVFKAKLDAFDKSVRQAIKRYEYAQQRGLQTGGFEIPLDQFGVPEKVGAGQGERPRPKGVPEGSRYDDAGRMWITPDGRVLVED